MIVFKILTAILCFFICMGCNPLSSKKEGPHRDKKITIIIEDKTNNPKNNNYINVSDIKLKKMAKEANLELRKYRELCKRYKIAFDNCSTFKQYEKLKREFNYEHEKFYQWMRRKKFDQYRGSTVYSPNYLEWYKKYNIYFENYSLSVKESQQFRILELRNNN